MKFKIAIAASMVALSGMAQAELIEGDLTATGDSLMAFDTDTGLEWMSLELTRNKSFDEILADLESNTSFSGYRFATQTEVEEMIFNVLGDRFSDDDRPIYPGGRYDDVSSTETLGSIMSIFGGTSPLSTTYANVYRDDTPGVMAMYGFYYYSPSSVYLHYKNGSVPEDEINRSQGYYIVSDSNASLSARNGEFDGYLNAVASDVPVPLFGLGALALSLLTLRRKPA